LWIEDVGRASFIPSSAHLDFQLKFNAWCSRFTSKHSSPIDKDPSGVENVEHMTDALETASSAISVLFKIIDKNLKGWPEDFGTASS
jgi:hypothetical protein